MSKFENKQNITKISFSQNIQCYCPLGNDWYTNHVFVEMQLGNVVPDYCEVDEFTRSIAGKSLIIEDVVNAVYEYLISEYSPKYLYVKSVVDDAKHIPVSVIKEME